jgi:membrane associated rhomboid family serine protease
MLNPVGRGIPPVTKNLLIINVIMFIFSLLKPAWAPWLYLFPPDSAFFRPYQIVTYMFMHGGFMHILFNMYALFLFGVIVEAAWGPKKFLAFYLICGLGAAVANMLMELYFLHSGSPMLGASGAIYGVLIAFAFLYPNERLMLLFPPIPIRAKYLVIGFIGLDLFSGLTGSTDGVAHFAHLGGALTATIILLFWRSRGKLYH